MFNRTLGSLERIHDQKILGNSCFDYFWGCGRDRRGDNRYGKVLMNVRAKLREERD